VAICTHGRAPLKGCGKAFNVLLGPSKRENGRRELPLQPI
jgi:hypothetical protein